MAPPLSYQCYCQAQSLLFLTGFVSLSRTQCVTAPGDSLFLSSPSLLPADRGKLPCERGGDARRRPISGWGSSLILPLKDSILKAFSSLISLDHQHTIRMDGVTTLVAPPTLSHGSSPPGVNPAMCFAWSHLLVKKVQIPFGSSATQKYVVDSCLTVSFNFANRLRGRGRGWKDLGSF